MVLAQALLLLDLASGGRVTFVGTPSILGS
jgi:hypothetical protein